ncbi:MAG TPA: hypothetical protein VE690_09225 [Rhodopila sp.]|nr:hypothetical protein [Rhodopila sp.]
MYPFLRRTARRPGAARDSWLALASLSLLTLILAFVLAVALRSPLKDDIAWLLYVAHRMSTGRELYVDVVEVNPPLIIWISAIPLELAEWLDTGVQFVAIPMFLAGVLAAAWWDAGLLRRSGGVLAGRVPVFAAIGAAFLVLPAADIGQREHLLAAAFLPYLILFAQSLEDAPPAVWESIAAGILAGLGCALKPRYAGVFLVLEGLALTRGLRPWRVLPIAAGLTLAGYAGLVALVCPAYLERAVPMALALYGATDVPFASLLSNSALLIMGLLVALARLFLRRRRAPHDAQMLTLVVFAATSLGVCFVDGKDWFYHRIPATLATALALMLWAASEVKARGWRPTPALAAAVTALCLSTATSFRQLGNEAVAALQPQATTVERLERIIRAEHAHTYVAFSEWLALGFPVVNNTGVTWASRFDSMWALKGEVWREGFDPAADKEWPIAKWVTHDFLAGCPDIVVVDTRETTHYIAVLSRADAAFARAWTRYRPIAAFDGLVVYRRGKSGCLDAWVAAETKPAITTR